MFLLPSILACIFADATLAAKLGSLAESESSCSSDASSGDEGLTDLLASSHVQSPSLHASALPHHRVVQGVTTQPAGHGGKSRNRSRSQNARRASTRQQVTKKPLTTFDEPDMPLTTSGKPVSKMGLFADKLMNVLNGTKTAFQLMLQNATDAMAASARALKQTYNYVVERVASAGAAIELEVFGKIFQCLLELAAHVRTDHKFDTLAELIETFSTFFAGYSSEYGSAIVEVFRVNWAVITENVAEVLRSARDLADKYMPALSGFCHKTRELLDALAHPKMTFKTLYDKVKTLLRNLKHNLASFIDVWGHRVEYIAQFVKCIFLWLTSSTGERVHITEKMLSKDRDYTLIEKGMDVIKQRMLAPRPNVSEEVPPPSGRFDKMKQSAMKLVGSIGERATTYAKDHAFGFIDFWGHAIEVSGEHFCFNFANSIPVLNVLYGDDPNLQAMILNAFSRDPSKPRQLQLH